MTIDELRRLCGQGAYVYLTIPRRLLPRGTHIRLCGRSGPQGRICTVSKAEAGFRVVATFLSAEIVKFIDSRGKDDLNW